MKWIFILALFGALVFAGDIVTLTDRDFERNTYNNSIMIVEFYAPWCQHCRKFEPEYEAFAKMVKEKGKKWVVAKLDSSEHRMAASRFNIRDYPTIKLFVDGSPSTYEGEKNAQDIFEYMERKTRIPSTELRSPSEIKARLEESKGRRVRI